MKKFVAMLLALMLVLVNVAALAEGPVVPDISGVIDDDVVEDDAANAATDSPSIKKTYTTTGTATNVYPTEKLKFSVTPKDESYPTVTVGTNNEFSVDGTTGEYTIPVNVPEASVYAKAGKYHYTVKETGAEVTSQAVGYDTTTVFNVDVYVYYKIVDGQVTNELEKTVVVYSGDETSENAGQDAKEDDFANTYSVGELTVTKQIAGNLADPNRVFTIKVTLTSTENVANDITIDSSNATSLTAETAKNWTTKEITFTAKGGQSITIKNIPTGVKYTIEEDGEITKHLENNDATTQMNNANDATAYYVEGEVETAKEIGTSKASEIIKNTKEITVPTGISMETLPYVLILAVAVMGAAVLVIRKREEY